MTNGSEQPSLLPEVEIPRIEGLEIKNIAVTITGIQKPFIVGAHEYEALLQSLPVANKEAHTQLEEELAGCNGDARRLCNQKLAYWRNATKPNVATLILELYPIQTFFLKYGINFNDEVFASRATHLGGEVRQVALGAL